MCCVLFELSILYLLHNASKLTEDPGNLSLAKINVSIISLVIFFFPNIDNSNRTQHTALIDCDLLAKVYINLIDQKEPTLDFKLEGKEKVNISLDNYLYCKKIIYPTKEEINNHKQYLKSTFKKNFFN